MQSLKSRLLAHEVVTGAYCFTRSPAVVEVLGSAGVDFVIIDMEHTPTTWETVEQMCRVADFAGITPLVRVASKSDENIANALEVGCAGVVLPFVRTVDDVRSAVQAAYYQPLGRRGVCGQAKVGGYGAIRPGQDDAAYARRLQQHNERVVLFVQIEDAEGVHNLPKMLELDPGIDIVGVALGDLANSLGFPGQFDVPVVRDAIASIISATRQCGRPVSLAGGVYLPDDVDRWSARGCRVYVGISDVNLLRLGTRAFVDRVDQARAAASPQS